jgi:hypothetical protein
VLVAMYSSLRSGDDDIEEDDGLIKGDKMGDGRDVGL